MLNSNNNRQGPIKSISEDKLNRQNFANYIVSIINNAPVEENSFVVAINGKWGEGKTSVKNLIINNLLNENKKNNNILFEFNTTEFQDIKELHKIFIDKILKITKNKDSNFRKIVVENRKSLLYLIIVGFIISSFIFPNILLQLSSLILSFLFIFKLQLRKLTLSTIMDVVSKSFIKIDAVNKILYYDEIKQENTGNGKFKQFIEKKCLYNKIVVFIDTFDYLELHQIKSLIQFVNNNKNIGKFVFILFYDRNIVENCLNTTAYSGSSFLENVVNIQLDLPLIRDDIFLTFFQGELQENYNLYIEYNVAFQYIKNYFLSLNKIYSFLDSFSVNYTLLSKGFKYNNFNCDKTEFLFLEILRFFENEVYREIRKNKNLLTKFTDKNNKKSKDELLNKILLNIKNAPKSNIIKLIFSLFPNFNENDEQNFTEKDSELYKKKSVGCFDFFDYYFVYDLSDSLISFEYFEPLKNKILDYNKIFSDSFKNIFDINSDSLVHSMSNSFISKLNKEISFIRILNIETLSNIELENFIKNILWLYIYSDRDVSTKKYLNNIFMYLFRSSNNIGKLIKATENILDGNEPFFYFYCLEFLIFIKRNIVNVIFTNDAKLDKYYSNNIIKIFSKYLEKFIMNPEKILEYLSDKNNFNSRLQLIHISENIKNYSEKQNNAEFLESYTSINKNDILIFKTKLLNNFYIIYSILKDCLNKKVLSNNKVVYFLNKKTIYFFKIDEIIDLFKEKKINKKDVVYQSLLDNKKLLKF